MDAALRKRLDALFVLVLAVFLAVLAFGFVRSGADYLVAFAWFATATGVLAVLGWALWGEWSSGRTAGDDGGA